MSNEDRLRDLLHGAEEPVGVGSFDDVRVRARHIDRRGRVLKAGAVALVVLVIAALSVTRVSDRDSQRVITKPAPHEVKVDNPIGLWPFTTGAEADRGSSELDFDTTDPVVTARAFLRTVAGMDPGTMEILDDGVQSGSANVVSGESPRRTSVRLRQLGSSAHWTVMWARSEGLYVDTPGPSAQVSNPVSVSGRATAFEGTVNVRIVDRSLQPRELGEDVLTGEMGELKPFSGDVQFDASTATLGAVIAVTRSAKDGSVEQVAAVPISWSTSQPDEVSLPKSEFGIADGQIVAVLDTQQVVILEDDAVRRVLFDAKGDVLDVDVSADRRTVVVASRTSACETEVRAIAADGSSMKVLGQGESVALSPSGRWLATTVPPPTSECGVTHHVIAVTDLSVEEPLTRFDDSPADNAEITQLTWVDDDTIVFEVAGQSREVRRLTVHDGAFRVLGSGDAQVWWSMPSRTTAGELTVYACCGPDGGSVELLDRDGVQIRSVASSLGEVFSYTYYGSVVYYLGKGGEFRTSDGRLLRHDVKLVAS